LLMFSLLKAVGPPGSMNFLALGCAIGLCLGAAGPRFRRVGRFWLLGLYVGYVVGGIPVVAHAIADRLPAFAATVNVSPRLDTVIVLGGDNSVGRLREAQRLLSMLSSAAVVVAGDEWIVEHLVEAGVPRERIATEDAARTTRDQIVGLAHVIGNGPAHVVIVASRLQMPRVAALLRAQHLEAMLAPAPVDIEPPRSGWRAFLPRYAGLRITRDALYEHLALRYYSRQGWIY
jgi:uncharacterized SAM-binding protein YcdF (DUF218 family)